MPLSAVKSRCDFHQVIIGFTLALLLMLFPVLLISCTGYPQIILSKKIFPGKVEQKDNINKIDEILNRYKLMGGVDKSYPVRSLKITRVFYTRYLADDLSYSPLAKINTAGVEYALKGMFDEAEVLFSEVLKEDKYFSSACNNLGVIYELLNNDDKAFSMYSKACLFEPGNKFYRRNLLYFCDKNSYSR